MARKLHLAGRLSPAILPTLLLLSSTGVLQTAEPAASAQQAGAREILDTSGIKGGLIVHAGCGDGKLTAALWPGKGYIVHGLDRRAANVQSARRNIQTLGLGGKVSVAQWTGGRLPYADNMVNLLLCEAAAGVPAVEVMRVLCPGGVAYVNSAGKRTEVVKPRPANIDQWTHYLHAADGNAVAADSVVGPPRHVQWKAGPTFARHHDTLSSISAMVSAGGRVFYVIDEGPTSLMHFPARWRLVARDAFNGVLLWKREISSWADYLRAFRSGPPQLGRRLVAAGERVYATLAADAPVAQLNAAGGATLRQYKGTEGTDEILLCEGVLLLVIVDAESLQAAQPAARRGIAGPNSPRSLLALDAETGAVLWRKSGPETAALQPLGTVAGGGRAVFQCGGEICCVELRTGRPLWNCTPGSGKPAAGKVSSKAAAKSATAKKDTAKKNTAENNPVKKQPKRPARSAGYYAPTVVLSKDHAVVLCADKGRLAALALEDDRELWQCPCPADFHAPADVFLADGLVWAGLFGTEGRDPKTGRIERVLDITGLLTPGHHPRCYRNKATDRFIISNKRGTEFFNLTAEDHCRHNWARGTCQYGIMPCNGLLYLPPNSCCCYAGALLHGFYALAPAAKSGNGKAAGLRLERGPAYGGVGLADSPGPLTHSENWPTFRADETRSGSTATALPTNLVKRWEADIGGKLSAPVVSGGKLLIASVDRGRIAAVDAGNGKPLWSFAAGGRVDTPPTVYRGLALFGAADGWVYCLRASDGQLVWRFRAAPDDRLVVVDEQLESTWPVHGSVLVKDGVAYLAAGRSCYLDGGIFLHGLDPLTGKRLYETRVVIPHSEDRTAAFVMAGARPDVLVTDGKYVYLQQMKFDARLVRRKDLGRHVMCHSGLADDAWFYRTFWRLGYGDAYDFPNSYIKHALQVPFGQLLAFDDQVVCGLQTFFSPGISPSAAPRSSRDCMLFGDPNRPFTPDEKTSPETDYPRGDVRRSNTPAKHKWTARLPFQARAMVLAGERVFVGGWPDVIDPADPTAAPKGKKGGLLWTFSAQGGEKLAETPLPSPPVFDGMAAADKRLYLSTAAGKVLCLTGTADKD